MKNLLLLLTAICICSWGQSDAQTINMGSNPINFGNGCTFGQIQDFNGTRKIRIGGIECLGPIGPYSTLTVDYFRDRIGIGYSMTSPSFQLQLSRNSAAKPGSAYWTVVSDARLKKDIRPYKRGLDLVKAIQPVYFKYNETAGVDDDAEFVGVIAQELQEVAPDMVRNIPDPDEKDKDTEFLSADLSQLDFALVNAAKELDQELQNLRAEVAQLREELRKVSLQKGRIVSLASLSVAPNPFQSEIRVMYQLDAQTQNASLEIYNLAGQRIRSEILDAKTKGEVYLSLGSTQPGTLIFKLVADGKVVASQQIIQAN